MSILHSKQIRLLTSKYAKILFIVSSLALVAGTAGLLIFRYNPDNIAQFFAWLRGIIGKEYDFEVWAYYSRKYLWLNWTAIFGSICGFLLSIFVPSNDWIDHNRLWRWLLWVAVVFGVFFRIYSWTVHFLWNDTLLLAASVKYLSYSQLFGPLGNDQTAPILFVLISKFLGEIFGYTSHVLGFFPLLLSLGSLYLFYKVSCRIFTNPVTRFFCMSLFAINTSLCFYAGEFKQYTGDVFCLLLILDQFQLALQRVEKYRHFNGWACMRQYYRENWGLLICGLLVLLMSQAALFSITAFGMILFFEWMIHKRGFTRGCVSLFPLIVLWCLSVLGALLHTISVLPSMMYDNHAACFAPLPISFTGWKWYLSFFSHCIKYPYGLALPISGTWIYSLLFFMIGCIYFVFFLRKWRAELLLPLLLVYVASILKQYPVSAMDNVVDSRLILFTVPLIILLYSGCIDFLQSHNKKIFRVLILFCWLSAAAVTVTATPFYADVAPFIKTIQKNKSDYLMIYTNFPGQIAMELLGDLQSKKVQCKKIEDKNLFYADDLFPVPGKYCIFCVHAEPQNSCMTNLPSGIKTLKRFVYSCCFLYELEYCMKK